MSCRSSAPPPRQRLLSPPTIVAQQPNSGGNKERKSDLLKPQSAARNRPRPERRRLRRIRLGGRLPLSRRPTASAARSRCRKCAPVLEVVASALGLVRRRGQRSSLPLPEPGGEGTVSGECLAGLETEEELAGGVAARQTEGTGGGGFATTREGSGSHRRETRINPRSDGLFRALV